MQIVVPLFFFSADKCILRRKMIQRAWTGRAPSRVVSSPRPPATSEPRPESIHYRRVLRFKVDEKVGITMATTKLGGLIVRDLETDEVLWELPVVGPCSHLSLFMNRFNAHFTVVRP